MGCHQSKASKHAVLSEDGDNTAGNSAKEVNKSRELIADDSTPETSVDGISSPPGIRRVWGQGSELYKLLESEIQRRSAPTHIPPSNASAVMSISSEITEPTRTSSKTSIRGRNDEFWTEIVQICDRVPAAAGYFHPSDLCTPLHLACKLVDDSSVPQSGGATALDGIRALITACPEAVSRHDLAGNAPFHYAFSPAINLPAIPVPDYKIRTEVIELLAASEFEIIVAYLSRNDIVYEENGGRTALYHAIESLKDDLTNTATSYEFVKAIYQLNPSIVEVRNSSDGDSPLALLYRRFVRQFDSSEKFFPGDNSRKEVVEHREEYKVAAMNTFRIIDLLLRPADDEGDEAFDREQHRLVHNASKIDCPPDLFRYIVETHIDQVKEREEATGRLPIHIAAAACPTQNGTGAVPHSAYHSKFVIDELLYAYRDGAAIQDNDGNYPLVLAINSGKKWIDGGLESLYEAFPEATHQIDMDNIQASLKNALSFNSCEYDEDGESRQLEDNGGVEAPRISSPKINRDNHHDAIMLVQKDGTSIWDIVSAMWANEEDGGVQMLGCMAMEKLAMKGGDEDAIMPIALLAVTALVNAMKNHPSEPAVQERACSALLAISPTDGKREVSFAASGAVASIVSAMQAHVNDAVVQEKACCALRKIVSQGGADRATVVASVSGFTAIVNAMGAHPEDCGVQKEACEALEVMTGFPNANLPDLPGIQTAPLLQEAKERFPEGCGESVDVILTRLT